jgi:tRNA threonylcarbamoyladenosine biosynthesis protein TsaE
LSATSLSGWKKLKKKGKQSTKKSKKLKKDTATKTKAMSIISHSATCDLLEMKSLAAALAKRLERGSTIALSGDLGAGKTTFAQMLCKELGINQPISSPTFTYLNIYEDKVAHFDLYRLENKEAFFALGFEEYLDSEFITLIEWPEIIEDVLPEGTIHLKFTHYEDKRRIYSDEKVFI